MVSVVWDTHDFTKWKSVNISSCEVQYLYVTCEA